MKRGEKPNLTEGEMKTYRVGDQAFRIDRRSEGLIRILEEDGGRQAQVSPFFGVFRVTYGHKNYYAEDARSALDGACFVLANERVLDDLRQMEDFQEAWDDLDGLYVGLPDASKPGP